MKRWSKILVTVLTLVMIVPMLTELVPLQVNAEDEAIHEVYLNKFDFEDAEVGKNLTADYLNRTVADGFEIRQTKRLTGLRQEIDLFGGAVKRDNGKVGTCDGERDRWKSGAATEV